MWRPQRPRRATSGGARGDQAGGNMLAIKGQVPVARRPMRARPARRDGAPANGRPDLWAGTGRPMRRPAAHGAP